MIIAGLPYLGQAIFGITLSVISDRIRASGRLEVTTIRKINSSIAYIPGAIFFALIPSAGCDQTWATVLLILIITFNCAVFSGLNSTHVDMSPVHAGILMGLTNSFGNIPGAFATYYAGLFTKSTPTQTGHTVHNWSFVFYTAAAVFLVTNLIYCLFASAKEQSWARPKSKPTEDSQAK